MAAGSEDRVWVLGLLPAGGSTRGAEAVASGLLGLHVVSFRRIVRRSDSDPRDALLDSRALGEEARGSTLGLVAGAGALAMLSVPARLPILGLEASDGCGKALVENAFDRSEPPLGSNLRKLGAGDWLAGGLEGRDGAAENDLLALKEGLEGSEGADLGWANEGLGRLKDGLGWLNDGLGGLTDGLGRLSDGLDRLELDPCWMLDMRCIIVLCLITAELDPDLSRPSACPPTMDEIRVAAVTTATAMRDRIVSCFHILPLLSSGVRPR